MSGCSRAKILGDKSWRGRQLSIKIVARRRIKVNVAGRRHKKEKKKKRNRRNGKEEKAGKKNRWLSFKHRIFLIVVSWIWKRTIGRERTANERRKWKWTRFSGNTSGMYIGSGAHWRGDIFLFFFFFFFVFEIEPSAIPQAKHSNNCRFLLRSPLTLNV